MQPASTGSGGALTRRRRGCPPDIAFLIAESTMWLATGTHAPRGPERASRPIAVLVDELHDQMREGASEWLRTPHPALGGITPLAAIWDGDADVVLELVRSVQ